MAVVAQSGAVGGVLTAWAKEFGLGISKFVSYGNGADLNEIDFLRYLADDAETRVVALYIESVAGGREFMRGGAGVHCPKARGRHQGGPDAIGPAGDAFAHRLAWPGQTRVYDAALRQCGAIRVHTIEEMFDLCKAFVHLPRLRGRRVAIVTNSGGPGVLAADRAEEVGSGRGRAWPGDERKTGRVPAPTVRVQESH